MFTKEEFVNQTLRTKTGERLKILSVEGESLGELIVKTDNKKMYQLLVAYRSGFLRFENDSYNQLFQNYAESKDAEEQEIQRRGEENLKRLAEQRRLEEEGMSDAIDSFRGKFAFLSNFHDCPVTYDGFTYRNNEAAFQAQKDLSRRDEFVDLNPTMAKRLGRKVVLRPDWERVKDDIMEEIVRCKFTQNPGLKEKLLETGERLLIEGNNWNDTYWGMCRGKGRNRLGMILMKIRQELRD